MAELPDINVKVTVSPGDVPSALRCYYSYFRPDYFGQIFNNGSVWVGYRLIDGILTFTCRGSDNPQDFLHDLESIEIMDNSDLGGVPEGFMIGVREVFAQIIRAFPSKNIPIKIEGHSLGGAHAYLIGALLMLTGYKVEIVVFGSPKPGMQKLKDIFDKAQTVIRSYRDGTDPVPLAPPFHSDFIHPVAPEIINCESIEPDPWGPVKGHHIQYYIIGLLLKESLNA